MNLRRADLVVVGGGIVGLATARELVARCPGIKLVVLEKEPTVAAHQTGHNSGVIHSGVYYRPGSLKAQTCVAGAALMVEFCREHGIAYEPCGKLIVATEASELPRLDVLHQRGVANGVPGLTLVGPERLREIEPHARGLKALHVPSAGIVDYRAVARAFADLVERGGGHIRTSVTVKRIVSRNRQWVLETSDGEMETAYLITCAGLHADRVAAMGGAPRNLQIVPFRGEYYEVVPARRHLVRAMIYPVPNPALPFLGVHFTRSIDGQVHAGPNAVLAFKREGYRKTDVHLGDTLAMLTYGGFWRMAAKYWQTGIEETWRSLSKRAFVHALQRLVPQIQSEDLVSGGSGVRAQAVDAHGALLDDFHILQTPRATHVLNVPSPAATASLRIGQLIAERVLAAGAPQLLGRPG